MELGPWDGGFALSVTLVTTRRGESKRGSKGIFTVEDPNLTLFDVEHRLACDA